MAENEVSIELNVDSSSAKKSIESFEKQSAKSFAAIDKSITDLGNTFKQFAAAALSFQTVKKAIDEAIEAESGVRRLNLAIASTGEYSKEASNAMLDFSNSLSEVTGIDDDIINGQLAIAKSFGITNDQAKELVRAATNLSAVTGQDLDSAVKQLGGTLDGSVGKLGLLGAEFRDLTEEQAKNLGAVDLINKKYGEAGEAIGNTFAGSLSKVANAFNDVFKDVGKQIIEDDGIKAIVATTIDVLKTLTPAITAIAKGFIFVFNLVVEGFGYIATAAGMAGETIGRALGLDSVTEASVKLQYSFTKLSEKLYEGSIALEKVNNAEFDKTLLKINESAVKSKKSVGNLGEEFRKLQSDADSFKKSILEGFGSTAETEAAKAQAALLKVSEFEKKGVIKSKEAYDLRLKIANDFNVKRLAETEKFAKEEADALEKSANEVRSRIEHAANQPIKFAIDEKGALSKKEIGASVIGGIGLALKGKSGAIDAVSQMAAGIGDAILPGIGGAVGGITQLLAQGPEATKAAIKGFMDAIPDIVIAIIDSLPAVIEALVEKLSDPEFLKRLGFALGKAALFVITGGLSAYAGEWAAKLVDALSVPFQKIFDPIISVFNSIGEMLQPAADAFQNLGSAINNAIAPFKDLADAIRKGPANIGGAGGAVGGFFSKIGKAIGLSHGGIVPTYAADGVFVPRGTDTVPAMLTPGELVIPRDMVSELGAFLTAQKSVGGSDTTMLAAILAAVNAPIVVNAEAKVNQNVFADIILQLNRQNARLTA